MSEGSRQALRNFYKLPSEDGSVDESEHVVKDVLEEGEQEDEELNELDQENVDVGAYVNKLVQTEQLDDVLTTIEQIKREKTQLASEQRELVNDNYKKLISAAETLGYLSNQGDLAEVNSLEEPIGRLAEWTRSLPT